MLSTISVLSNLYSLRRLDAWKLHEYFEDGTLELYNLQHDEGERHHVADKYPERTEELLAKLKTWRARTHAPVPTESNAAYDAGYEQRLLRNTGG